MSGLSSVFPPPPSNYKHFTNENVEKLAAWKQGRASEEMNILSDMMSDSFHKIDEVPSGLSPSSKPKVSDVPEYPLDLLIPPKPPMDGPYRSFGNIWQSDDKLLSLKEMGITQLYTINGSEKVQATSPSGDGKENSETDGKIPDIQDRIFELKKLLNSLLVQFVELTGIMSISPEYFPDKTEDLRVILINIHHLLNEYRPHQSRESLILLMEDQLAAKKKDIDDLKKTNDDIRKKISDLTTQFGLLLPSCEATSQEDSTKVKYQTSIICEQEQNIDLLQWQLLDYRPS